MPTCTARRVSFGKNSGVKRHYT